MRSVSDLSKFRHEKACKNRQDIVFCSETVSNLRPERTKLREENENFFRQLKGRMEGAKRELSKIMRFYTEVCSKKSHLENDNHNFKKSLFMRLEKIEIKSTFMKLNDQKINECVILRSIIKTGLYYLVMSVIY